MGIFDQIKNAFGKGEDAPAESPAPTATAATGPVPKTGSYTVQSGDTLWKIAEDVWGDGARYTELYEANRDVLEHPDRVRPGQSLRIPQD
jgi:nucleoid-associated protein YgaU